MRQAYRDIVNQILDTAIHSMIDLKLTSNLGPHPLFAVAAYKITYETRKWRNILPNIDLAANEEPQR